MKQGTWVKICSKWDKQCEHIIAVNKALGYAVYEKNNDYYVLVCAE